ncbi:MAG: FAD-binding oxidoreductase [Gemmatimonadota bacterium]
MTDAALASSTPIWDDGHWLGYSPLRGDTTADVCVVGLGGSGLACIHELLTQGARVAGVDAGAVGGGAGGRNGGFFLAGVAAFHHDAAAALGHDRATALYRRTLAEMDRMTAETPALIRRVGSLRIAASDDELKDCEAQYGVMIADGLPVERYHGPEGDGLLFPADGVFNPLLRCRDLATRASLAGARLFEGTAAIDVQGGAVVTANGTIRAPRVIVAVDGGLALLFPEIADQVRSVRLQMLATAPAPEVTFPRPVYLRYGFEYFQQLPDQSIAIGGFRDAGGDAEWTDDPSTSPELQGLLEGLLREQLHVRAPITHRWAGVVSYTASGLPLVAEVRPRVWALGGYNGTGNVVGAVCGRGVAQLVTTGDTALLRDFLD